MGQGSTNFDGAYARSELFTQASSWSMEESLHPDLFAIWQEFGDNGLTLGAMLRVAREMQDYGLDPSSDEGQQTAARVIRDRLTRPRPWATGSLETYQRRADIEASSETEFVYYVDLYGAAIKIGYTANLTQRLSSLRRRLSHLLAVEPGGRAREAFRHRMFDLERIEPGREDFHRSNRLLEHIKKLREQHGEPADILEAAGRAKRTA